MASKFDTNKIIGAALGEIIMQQLGLKSSDLWNHLINENKSHKDRISKLEAELAKYKKRNKKQ